MYNREIKHLRNIIMNYETNKSMSNSSSLSTIFINLDFLVLH